MRDVLLDASGPAVVAALRIANFGGEPVVLVPATALLVLLLPAARRRWWLWVGLMLLAPLLEGLLKEAIGRPRPEDAGLGFPSGHATAAAAYCGALAYLAGSLSSPALRAALRILALLAVLAVAAARVVLRAHWPSDALGGIALGLALAAAAALVDATVAAPAAAPDEAPEAG